MAKRNPRKTLINKLDKVFSDWAKTNHRRVFGNVCPFCGKAPVEQAFHWITRAKYSTRWDPDNICGSCAGCNLRMEYESGHFYKWFYDHHGKEAFDKLYLKSNKLAKFSLSDLENMISDFKKRLDLING